MNATEPGRHRPQLKLVIEESRASRWKNGNPAFSLHHVGGQAARAIQIDPLRSRLDKDLEIHFGSVDLLDLAHPLAPVSVVLKSREPRAGASFEADFFNPDCRDAASVSYPVLIRFQWAGERHEDETNLLWIAGDRRLRMAEATNGSPD